MIKASILAGVFIFFQASFAAPSTDATIVNTVGQGISAGLKGAQAAEGLGQAIGSSLGNALHSWTLRDTEEASSEGAIVPDVNERDMDVENLPADEPEIFDYASHLIGGPLAA